MPADWILANENWKCRYQPVVYPQTGDDPGMRVGAIYAAALYVAMLQATLNPNPNPNPHPNPKPNPNPKPIPNPNPNPNATLTPARGHAAGRRRRRLDYPE